MSDTVLGIVVIAAASLSGALGFCLALAPAALRRTLPRKIWLCIIFAIAVVAGAAATFWQGKRTAKDQGLTEQRLTDTRQAVTDANTKLADTKAQLIDANAKLSEIRGQVKLVQDAAAHLNTNSSAVYALLQVLSKNLSVAAVPLPSKPVPIDPRAELAVKTAAMSNHDLALAAETLVADIRVTTIHCSGLLDNLNTQKISLSTVNREGAARDRTANNIQQMEKLLGVFITAHRASYRGQVGPISTEILSRIDVAGPVQDPIAILASRPRSSTDCSYFDALRMSLDNLSQKLPK